MIDTDNEKIREAVILQLALENCGEETVEWLHPAVQYRIKRLKKALQRDIFSHIDKMELSNIL